MNQTQSPESTAAWQASLVRLTAFPLQPVPLTGQEWWSELVGEPPEQDITLAKEGRRQVLGPVSPELAPGILILTIDRSRIEWRLTSKPGEELPGFLGDVPEVMGGFHRLISPWLTSVDVPVQRLALGAEMRLPVPDRQAGYQFLSETFLPFRLDPDSTDFLYRINRPTTSRVLEGSLINRLETWSVVQEETILMSASAGGTADVVRTGGPFSCRLEVDINTDKARADALPVARLDDLLGEFETLARQVAQLDETP